MLTQKQEGFTLDLFRELPEVSAYKNHYSTANMSKNAVYVEACRLANHPKITLRLEELRQPVVEAAIASVTERKERLTTFIRENNYTEKGNLTRSGNIMATSELNRMEKAYDEGTRPPAVVQTFVFILPDGTRVIPGQLKEGQ